MKEKELCIHILWQVEHIQVSTSKQIVNMLQSGTKPLEKIHKTCIFNLNDGKQRVKTVTPPHTYNVARGWNF